MSSTRRPHAASDQRGVTLMEMLVSLVLLGLVLSAAATVFMGQANMFRNRDEAREAQRSARDALSILTRYLTLAGYGIGPEFAFDFERHACPANCPRDRLDAPDEIVFHLRNPMFAAAGTLGPGTTAGRAWHVVDLTPHVLELERTADIPGTALLPGQVYIVQCSGFTYLYATQAAGVFDDGSILRMRLEPPDANDPFRQNFLNHISLNTCFNEGGARAFAVDRYRFFIGDGNGAVWDPQSGRRPYLMLDRGLRDAAGAPIIHPVAPDIEDIQVAYITRDGSIYGSTAENRATAGQILTGQTAALGDPIDCAREIRVPFYTPWAAAPCLLGSDERRLPVASNIVAVRITIVARTPQASFDGSGRPLMDLDSDPSLFLFENRTPESLPPHGGFRRVRMSTTVELPNMSSRGVPLL